MATGERASAPLILVADDESALRDLMAMLLELEGYRVQTVADGREALHWLARNRCSLLITDHMMPVMDGVELIGHIRADTALSALPVLLVSAGAPDHVGETSGADRFLRKPFDIPRLLTVIGRLVQPAANGD